MSHLQLVEVEVERAMGMAVSDLVLPTLLISMAETASLLELGVALHLQMCVEIQVVILIHSEVEERLLSRRECDCTAREAEVVLGREMKG
jgi:hypothetical protein